MSNLIYDNVQDNFIDPEIFTQKLQTLSEQLPSILDDFKKYYVFYNKNPEYDEYKSHFDIVKNNLNAINSQIFTLSNDVQTNIDSINEILLNRTESEWKSEVYSWESLINLSAAKIGFNISYWSFDDTLHKKDYISDDTDN